MTFLRYFKICISTDTKIENNLKETQNKDS